MSKTRSVFARIAEAIEAQNSLLEDISIALNEIAYQTVTLNRNIEDMIKEVKTKGILLRGR
ncbi:MAG: hypothetical protein K6T73_08200 [Candidatus Bathyarchaeota archaeon]|nr:hypothetical protein [Candidatus Bathyarchaeota archaeon]